ncbi:tetratricopeptide repeat protein [Streptosporangiaceae bacterium NEAU-GS5]|nr:tetratricopeptide repeat protein [Streptosporangiaceae bacterium NEAU-GS5]
MGFDDHASGPWPEYGGVIMQISRDDAAWYVDHLRMEISAAAAVVEQGQESGSSGSAAEDHIDFAGALVKLGRLQLDLGMRHEASAAVDDAIRLLRSMRDGSRQGLDARLAAAQEASAMVLARLGRRTEALEAAEEAVSILRRPAQDDPKSHECSLADALSTHARQLGRLGHGREAVLVAAEAVEVHRRHAVAGLNSHSARLAYSLDVLGFLETDADRALAASQEAVTLYQRLPEVTGKPLFVADLARALRNHAFNLLDLGRRNEAASAATQAVTIYRDLAAIEAAAFDSYLADALEALAQCLWPGGRLREAEAAIDEALGMCRRLAQSDPETFAVDLAYALATRGTVLAVMGRHDDSLADTQEAMTAFQMLNERFVGVFDSEIATTMLNQASALVGLGRVPAALEVNTRLVELRRRMAAADPGRFRVSLAAALMNLGKDLLSLGRVAEALDPTQEAVELLGGLMEREPDRFAKEYGLASTNLGVVLAQLGRAEQGMAVMEKTVATYRRLAQDEPLAFEPDLARALMNLAVHLAKTGRHAVTAATEAVEIFRRVVTANPGAFTDELAMAERNLAFATLGAIAMPGITPPHGERGSEGLIEKRGKLAAAGDSAGVEAILQELRQGRPANPAELLRMLSGVKSALADENLTGETAWAAAGARAMSDVVAAELLEEMGRRAAAIASLEAAREAFTTIKDDPQLARCQFDLGRLYRSEDRLADAEAAFRNAGDILSRLAGFDEPAADCEYVLGDIYFALGRHAEAERRYHSARALFGRLGRDMTGVNLGLAQVYMATGRPQEALELLREKE